MDAAEKTTNAFLKEMDTRILKRKELKGCTDRLQSMSIRGPFGSSGCRDVNLRK